MKGDLFPRHCEAKIDLPNDEFDVVFCSHVLEPLNDQKAQSELFRVLEPGGLTLIMVLVIHGWDVTYKNPQIRNPVTRTLHFG